MGKNLLELRPEGLYCERGGFHIDPVRSVARAVITHAHSDHARPGSRFYLTVDRNDRLLQARLGNVSVQTLTSGEVLEINGVRVSFHPAGHILGSAQVRVESGGEVWVVTGDYKLQADPTCDPFGLVRCHTLVTESTFGLPVYRWPEPEDQFKEINRWWRTNQAEGRTSILYGYALGKAQRLLAGIDASLGPIYVHESVELLNEVYRGEGVALPETGIINETIHPQQLDRALIITPQSSGNAWLRQLPRYSDAFASGWMQIRGRRQQSGVDRGFILSDHVDWPDLIQVIEASGARRVLTMHGYSETVARYLRGIGYEAYRFDPAQRGGREAEEIRRQGES